MRKSTRRKLHDAMKPARAYTPKMLHERTGLALATIYLAVEQDNEIHEIPGVRPRRFYLGDEQPRGWDVYLGDDIPSVTSAERRIAVKQYGPQAALDAILAHKQPRKLAAITLDLQQIDPQMDSIEDLQRYADELAACAGQLASVALRASEIAELPDWRNFIDNAE